MLPELGKGIDEYSDKVLKELENREPVKTEHNNWNNKH